MAVGRDQRAIALGFLNCIQILALDILDQRDLGVARLVIGADQCRDGVDLRPLRRALVDLDAWITGLRRDQWASRSNIRKVDSRTEMARLNP